MRVNLPEFEENNSDKIKRIFINVKEYQLSDDGNHFVIGTDLLGIHSGIFKIRLTTSEERAIDRPKQKLAKIKQQYSDKTIGRDTILDKAKDKATVIAFDDLISLNDNNTYRAHWLSTLSTVYKPCHFISSTIAHIELKQKTEYNRSRAFVEHIENFKNLKSIKSREEFDRVFIQAFSPDSSSGKPQRPFALLDLRYNDEPVLALLPRLYPSQIVKNIQDSNNNESKEVNVPAPGIKTMHEILSGKRKGKNARETFALDVFRATYAALTSRENCAIYSDGQNRDLIEKIFKGLKNNKIDVNLISGISVNFGPASAQTYLDDAEKKYLSLYNLKREVGDNNKFIRNVNGYAPILMAMREFEDGSNYLTHAMSIDPYPKTLALNEVDLAQAKSQIHKLEFENPEIFDVNARNKITFTNKMNTQKNVENNLNSNNNKNTVDFYNEDSQFWL